jgi:Family of unknown function (DUF6448)
VTAARQALARSDVDVVLPYVPVDCETEVRDAFHRAVKARALGPEARDVADRWFFETVVRVHRAGEGAPFTGLKPAGLDVGPVIPAAERSLASGSTDELIGVLCDSVRSQAEQRHGHAMALKEQATESTATARAYVEAMLGLQMWAHALYRQVMTDPHARSGAHEHE